MPFPAGLEGADDLFPVLRQLRPYLLSRAGLSGELRAQIARVAAGEDERGAQGARDTPAGRWRAVDGGRGLLLGTMKDSDVSARMGQTVGAVQDRRYALNVPAFIKRKPRGESVAWTPSMDRKLGMISDAELAGELGCTPTVVFNRRRRLGIPAYRG